MLTMTVEQTNSHDTYAVAVVLQNGAVVSHIPRNFSRVILFFFKKDKSIAYCEVTGERTNRGAGLRLNTSCVHRFYGRHHFID